MAGIRGEGRAVGTKPLPWVPQLHCSTTAEKAKQTVNMFCNLACTLRKLTSSLGQHYSGPQLRGKHPNIYA